MNALLGGPAAKHPVWDTRRLWSLWELMREFDLGSWSFLFSEMGTWIQGVTGEKKPNKIVPQEALKYWIKTQFQIATLLATYAQLPESKALLDRIKYDFIVNPKQKRWKLRRDVKSSVLLGDVHHLKELMEHEFGKKKCLLLSDDVARYYQDPEKVWETHFGLAVDRAFPSVKADVIEAGNCLACGRNNAAVYHLMRVAEVGLRVLAWDRRVVAKNKGGNPIPLELAEWGSLIRDVEAKVKEIQNWRSKLTREDAHQFYNRLLVEARAFNDGWRRHVMHSRSHTFDDSEALALWSHVMRFMQTMAKRLSEAERMPRVWR
ncbi:MAG: hypothetical protein WB764_28070 [Xanthobacteraceae bacterium]